MSLGICVLLLLLCGVLGIRDENGIQSANEGITDTGDKNRDTESGESEQEAGNIDASGASPPIKIEIKLEKDSLSYGDTIGYSVNIEKYKLDYFPDSLITVDKKNKKIWIKGLKLESACKVEITATCEKDSSNSDSVFLTLVDRSIPTPSSENQMNIEKLNIKYNE